jgi:hypothetical protein
MNTRLIINLTQGLLEVEGSEDFVRSIYQDFREQVSAAAALKSVSLKPVEQIEAPTSVLEDSRRPTKQRRQNSPEAKSKTAEYKPTFKNLNLAGLAEFYAKINPANHSEKILCFAIFLRDNLKISPCSPDDIYTCYFTLKSETKTPEAFQQAFITAKNRTHFIEIEWPTKIDVTIAGDNFYNDKLRKAGTAK